MRKITTYRLGKGVSLAHKVSLGSLGLATGIAMVTGLLDLHSAGAAPADYQHQLISKNTDGELGNSWSYSPALSTDGRYVAFQSDASNLVPNDTNGTTDVFVKDRTLGAVKRISMAAGGTQADGPSFNPRISGNGRYVVYGTNATNIVPNDTNGTWDVLVYDLQTDTNVPATVNAIGQIANLGGGQADINYDGSQVVFSSSSNNLVPGFNPYNQTNEIFVKNMTTNEIKLVSAAPDGTKGNDQSGTPRISCDGATISFSSRSTNLTNEPSNDPSNVFQKEDLFVAKAGSGSYGLKEITNAANYHSGSAAISCDGKYLALESAATNIVDGGTPSNGGYNRIYKYDIQNNIFNLVSVRSSAGQSTVYANGEHPEISSDGRYITYVSDAGLDDTVYGGTVGGSTYAMLTDTANGISRVLTINSYNKEVGGSQQPVISADGSFVAYINAVYNYTPQNMGYDDPTRALVPEDTTGYTDIYVTKNILKSADTVAPVVTGTADRQPDANGWYNHDATVTWNSVDPQPSSGTPTQPAATVAGTEGKDVVYTSSQSCDPSANCAAGSYTLSLDKTAPTLGSPAWTANPKARTSSTVLTVPVSDGLSGVAGGEYFIANDPGAGNGAAMQYTNGSLTASFGTNFVSGVYDIGVRARDDAGNWSPVTKVLLVVYDANGPGVTGKNKKDLIPRLSNGDVLPGLIATDQTDAVDYGFTLEYKNGGLNPQSDLQLLYNTGNRCGKPEAANCHSLAVNATSFAWLVVDQTNSSRAQFRGIATVTADGVTTNNPFSVTAIDGDRLSPSGDDRLALQVFAPGVNPDTASPIYKFNDIVAKSNGVRIR